ncbi:growth hormone secretagogue receptor a isoform X2 [Danio rerio]|uniref:Growth hormone secretagogue receptor a isoform X2 n=1 Tax=Danio rerio TaxID=7955 RepID=A0AC58H6A7_DANRE
MPTWTNRSNCSFNCSWDDNATYWGIEQPVNIFPIPVLTGVTVTCVLFFFVGVTGNLMTILVVTKYKDMRTTTNLYLSSMAFSDLLIFLCMPLDLYRIWRAKVVVTKGRVRGVILVLWIVSFFSAGPVFVLVGVEHENGTNSWDTNECKATEYAIRSGLLTIMVWVSSIFFFLPVFCLTVLYSLIGRKLWKRKRETIGENASSRDKSNRQTVKMLAVVVFAFVLCWLPFHVGRYLISKSTEMGSPVMSIISHYCNLISFVLFYLSAAINPILYNIMSKKYRMAACKLFGLRNIPRRSTSVAKGESSPCWTESTASL